MSENNLDLPSGVIYSMTNIVRNRDKHLSNELALIGFTLPEWRAMRIIRSFNKAIPMSILIAHSQTDRTALGRTIERLVMRGFIEKLPDPNDKRAFLISWLDQQNDKFDTAYEIAKQYDINLLDHLSEDEKSILLSALSRVESNSAKGSL